MNREDIIKTINSLKGEAGHKKVIEVYNAQEELPRGYKLKASDAWCAATVSVVFLMNGYPYISECSCPQMILKAQKFGIWQESDAYRPQLGDIIMYDWQDSGKGDNVGNPDHVGIVVKVDGDKITVREGNKAKTVGNRTLKVNDKYIRGYITPRFGAESKEEPKADIPTPSAPKPQETPQAQPQSPYKVGQVYTVSVRSALNVRKGAGKQFATVGYRNLTPDGKKHANGAGALLNGTRVTCNDVKVSGSSIWIKIPSGWICARDGSKIFVK